MPAGVFKGSIRKKSKVTRHQIEQPMNPAIRYIPLNGDRHAIVDSSDYEFLSQWNWSVARSGTENLYASRFEHTATGPRVHVLMHRLLIGAQPDQHVDHINCNGLDNRRANLRFATRSQNAFNNRRIRPNTSGLKGVYVARSGRIKATITTGRKSTHLGYFDTPEAAHAAYMDAARKIAGEFARAA